MNAESVGGSMFEIAVNALAKKGRVVIIGMMSQYSSGWKPSQNTGLPEKLLWKSASLSGVLSFNSTSTEVLVLSSCQLWIPILVSNLASPSPL